MKNEEARSFLESLEDLEKEKGIDKEVILETIKNAMLAAYKKNYGTSDNTEIVVDDAGEIKVYTKKTVVKMIEDEGLEITLAEAKKVKKTAKLGDEVIIEENCEEFRRNAVQNAKQIIIQKIREEGRNSLIKKYEEYKGDIISGLIKYIDKYGNVYLDLGDMEASLPPREQIPTDIYKVGKRLRVYLTDVLTTTKYPKVLISRKDAGFLKALLTFEVPEIEDEIVKIVNIARDPGNRAKVAVYAEDSSIDPVGACIGASGARIKAVLNEIMPEKIDLVEWSPDLAQFIANALKPAKIVSVTINEEMGEAEVVVEKDQLSLAIGKFGQNAKLTARLTDTKINIISTDPPEPALEDTVAEGIEEKTEGIEEKNVKENDEENEEE